MQLQPNPGLTDFLAILWNFEPVHYLIIALIIALVILMIPKKVLLWLGKHGVSANKITITHMLFCWLALVLLLIPDSPPYFIVFICMLIGLLLDRVDGKMAQYLEEEYLMIAIRLISMDQNSLGYTELLKELNKPYYPGKTERGKWLDPLTDKLAVIPMFVYLGYKCHFPILLLGLVAFIEFIGIITRPPANLCKSWIKDVGATSFGKTKMVLQSLFILYAFFEVMGCGFSWEYQLEILFGLSLLFTFLSVASRFRYPWKWMNKAVDETNRPFTHTQDNDLF